MMKNYNITINNDKSISCDEEIHINFLENEVTTLTFQIPSELDDFSSVCVLETPNKKKKTLPINNNILIISNEISFAAGNWNLIFYSIKDETVFVSDKLSFKVEKNYLDKEEAEPMDQNIEILYLELQETMKQLESVDLENLDTDIDTLKNGVSSIISLSSQILEIVNYNKTTLNTVNAKVEGNLSISNTINTKLGDFDGSNPPKEGTIWHNTYWGLKRAEGANFNAELAYQNTNTILSLLTDANVIAAEILEELE